MTKKMVVEWAIRNSLELNNLKTIYQSLWDSANRGPI